MPPAKIFIAGHHGMVGSALLRILSTQSGVDIIHCNRQQLDLCCQADVQAFFAKVRPSEVYLAAAKVGGIYANNHYPVDFIYQNIMIQANVITAAWQAGVKRLLFLGSSCIYPRNASQPMMESALLTGTLEATNEPYGIAKITGIKLCESYNRQYDTDFRSVMPCNLYGQNDNYHPQNSHVLPALISRFHEAKQTGTKEVKVWGSGKPRREFLYVDDLAAACVHIMQLDKTTYQAHTKPQCSHINIGAGQDLSIAELATSIAQVIGYKGNVVFDTSQPDGSPQKLLDVSMINTLGWQAKISLEQGLALAYEDFVAHHTN